MADPLVFLRDFNRYTGDGLPNAPTGAPLPIGDPTSGAYVPTKKDLRDWVSAIAIQVSDEAIVLTKADNLAAVADKSVARTNLSLYSKTEVDTAVINAKKAAALPNAQARLLPLRASFYRDSKPSYAKAREAAAAIMATIQRSPTRTAVYCSPTGNNTTGTSWATAFTSLTAAVSALTAGGILYTDSTEVAPIAAPSATIGTALTRVEWVRDAGPNLGTWIDPRQKGTWTAEAGGVFSIAIAAAPYAVGFDVKRDSISGTVTGVDLTQARVADAIAAWGLEQSDLVAWYGWLKKSATSTTTPAAGEWAYTGGKIYAYPLNSPTVTDMNTKAIWSDGRAGLQLSGEVRDCHFHGNLTVLPSPADADGAGYSLRLTNASRVVDQGTRSILSGYHSIGFTNASLTGNIILDHVTVGYMKNGIPLVFYTSAADMKKSGHCADNAAVLAFGLLNQNGAPIDTTFNAITAYSHTDGTKTLGGLAYSRLLQIDFIGQLNAKHGTTVTPTFGGVSAENTGATPDVENPESFGVRVRNSVFLGMGAFHDSRVLWDDCVFDRLGYGSSSVDMFSASTVGFGTGSHQWLLRNCLIRMGLHRYVISALNSNGVDRVMLDGCSILLQNSSNLSAFINASGQLSNAFVLRNTIVDSVTAGVPLVIMPNTIFAGTPFANIKSYGGNAYGVKLDKPLGHTNGISFKTIAEWLAATDPSGLDASQLDGLVWS